MHRPRWAFVAILLLAVAARASAQSAANVLVVANEALPASIEIADYYAKRRGLPPDQVLKIQVSTADQITRAEFEFRLQAPIAAWLQRHAAQDRIHYIVLVKGIPLRIAGTGGRSGSVASVDSELTLLYRRMTGQAVAPHGSVPNPYYLGEKPVDAAARFTHDAYDIYLVTRLDGFTADDVKALVDRGIAPASGGQVVLDQRAGLDKPNEWLAEAARRLETQGLRNRVVFDETSRVVGGQTNVLGYYSWGSNDPEMTERHPQLEFAPGALAAMFVSSDARTFAEPDPAWKPGRWETRTSYFAGSPQSLTGDLVRAGVTGAAGYVAEPYLDHSIRPEILFPAYFAGHSLAEAFYMALPALSWQSIVVGDPLCSPFVKTPLPPAALNPPLDMDTELPAHFSERRIAASGLKGDAAAIKLMLRAESRLARGDRAGTREALEAAVKIDSGLAAAWRTLGTLYDDDGDHTRAAAAYRKVLETEPKDAISLNNLAYNLAVREGKPAEALPLAERALALAPQNALIADTVGWIKHLLGDHAGALKLLVPAAKALPASVEVQLHAAAAYASAGRLEDAAAALKAAEAADPNARERPEFQDVMRKIGK